MAVYAIFDKEARRVLIEPFQGGRERLKWIPIDIEDPLLVASAERGFYAVYRILERKDNLCISYEFEGGGEKIIGSSAALAFDLALLEELEGLDLRIAATGDISDSTRSSKILPVEMIPEKLNSGINALSEAGGGIIFYPHANEDDVTEELRKQADAKGIILRPVKTLAEAVAALVEIHPKRKEAGSEPEQQTGRDRSMFPGSGAASLGRKFRRGAKLLLVLLVLIVGAISLVFVAHVSRGVDDSFLTLRVRPSAREGQVLPLAREILVPALKANNWRFDATISCRSRLLENEYTYYIRFETATLTRGHGKPDKPEEINVRPCMGSGRGLEEAKRNALEKLWRNLQEINATD